MKRRAKLLVFLGSLSVGLCLNGYGQNFVSAPPLALNELSYIPSNGLVGNGVSLVQMGRRCFYVQLVSGGRLENSIRRISFDGKDVKAFDVNRILRPASLSDRTPYVESFIVGSDGSVLVLTRWMKDQVSDILNILVFDEDATLQTIIPVPLEEMQILHFARFNDGKFIMLAGTDGQIGFSSVEIIILDGSGAILSRKPLRRLTQAEEQQVADAIENHAKSNGEARPRPDHEMEALLSRTVFITGDDGLEYMARPDRPGSLYRVSSSGDIVEMHIAGALQANNGDSHKQLMNGAVHAGELMLFYADMRAASDISNVYRMYDVEIKTFNMADGRPLETYSGDLRLSTLLVGWDDNIFYFLKYVKKAQPPGFEIVAATP